MKEYTIDDYVREECERDPAFRAAWEAEAAERALALSMRRWRGVGGGSIEQLAEETGIEKKKLSRIERGEAMASKEEIRKISMALGLKVCESEE